MSNCFKGYLHKGWAVTAIISLLVLIATVVTIMMLNTKIMPNKPLGKLLWMTLGISALVMVNSVGIKIMHNFVIVPTSLWLVYGLLISEQPLMSVGIVFLILTIISFSCSAIYKHAKGIPA